MKERNKKVVALLLTAAMAMSVGVTANATERISEETITLTVSGAMPSGLEDWTNLACIEEYENRLGIKLDCSGFVSTDWPTQRTLMFASDELTDMIMNAGMAIADVNNYGSQGYLLDFNEYRDLMPNMVAAFEEHPELEAYLTTEDGHIYGMTQLGSDVLGSLARVFINRNWLENVGMEIPTTLDELYNVLVAFKEQDANGNGDPNDEIPMLWDASTATFMAAERAILDAFGIYASGAGQFYFVLQADDDGQVYFANTSENYKEFLKFMKKLWDEGLIDPDAFTYENADQIKMKAADDQYGFFGCASAPFVLAGTDISYDKNWAALLGMESEYNPDRGFSVASSITSGIKFVASATTEYPEEIAKFVDYFFTEEGRQAAVGGYEGQGWNWVENEVLGVQVIDYYCPEGYSSAEEYRYKGNVLNTCLQFYDLTSPAAAALFEQPLEKITDTAVVEKYGWAALLAEAYRQDGVTEKETYPVMAYTTEENEVKATYKTDISSYVKQMEAEFITGQSDIDEDWDTYVETINQMGLPQVLEAEQAAYDRYQAVVANK